MSENNGRSSIPVPKENLQRLNRILQMLIEPAAHPHSAMNAAEFARRFNEILEGPTRKTDELLRTPRPEEVRAALACSLMVDEFGYTRIDNTPKGVTASFEKETDGHRRCVVIWDERPTSGDNCAVADWRRSIDRARAIVPDLRQWYCEYAKILRLFADFLENKVVP